MKRLTSEDGWVNNEIKSQITQYCDAIRLALGRDVKALSLSGEQNIVIQVHAALFMANGRVELRAVVRDTQREYRIMDVLSVEWWDANEEIDAKYPAFWERIKARILPEYYADLTHPFIG